MLSVDCRKASMGPLYQHSTINTPHSSALFNGLSIAIMFDPPEWAGVRVFDKGITLMGPTNVALVKLFQADQKLREAQGRLDATTKNVRIQERRVRDLTDRITASQTDLTKKLA